MLNVLLGVGIGVIVAAGLTWAGTVEEMAGQRERNEQVWERFEQRQERARERGERSRVPWVEPVYPGWGRGPC